MPVGATILQESLAHTVNVAIHVAFGSLALVLGLLPLLTKKGGRYHVAFGRFFLLCLAVVIFTAVIGILAFGFRAFLGVITLLAAYEAYSGYRVLSVCRDGLKIRDAAGSIVTLVAAVLFVVRLHSVDVPWAPVIIYSTLGTLVAIATYDLSRFLFPRAWLLRTWWYEHVIKMLGAYTAVLSAFSGTVLEQWQPYSQILPSVAGTTATIGLIVYYRRHQQFVRQV